jgi:squalene synthase HpnC
MIPLDRSYLYCKETVESHYENFPVASRLLPARTRPAIAVLYAFARAADDFADEEPDTDKALSLLSGWRELLHRAAGGPVDHPVFRALSDVIARYDLPVPWLDHLIMAFERDRTVVRHKTYEDLLYYSSLSANPVGRLLLWIHGVRSEPLFARSDAICTALQLANFWQDIPVDWEKGRVYVPTEELRAAGLSEEDLTAPDPGEALLRRQQHLKDRLFSYTAGLFSTGIPLPRAVRGRVGLELALVWKGGVTILDKGRDPTRRIADRPVLGKADWIRALFLPVALRSLEGRISALSGRAEAEELFRKGRSVYEEKAASTTLS